MVEDRDVPVAREHEVAVHAVHGVFVGGDCELRGGETLGDRGAAEDAAGAGRMPEGAGVGEDVGADVCEWEELECVLNGRVMGKGRGGFDQGCVRRGGVWSWWGTRHRG